MTAEEKGFLAAIKRSPKDATARGAYADWLDEHDRGYEATLQRGKAGLSDVYFKLRRKSDGLYSEGPDARYGKTKWSPKGKMWRKLSDVRSHLVGQLRYGIYGRDRDGKLLYNGDTAWEDLEVVVVELRVLVGAALPLAIEYDAKDDTRTLIDIVEPKSEA